MTTVQFCYWLQGFMEVGNPKTLNEEQLQMIKNHLKLCFQHDIDNQYTEKQKEELKKIHALTTPVKPQNPNTGRYIPPDKTPKYLC